MRSRFSEIKARLFAQCLDLIDQRIATARETIEAATAAAHEETKSSAGDKYETTRAMMQLEQEKNEVQLAKALQLKNELLALGPDKVCTKAEPGSLVVTDHGIFYMAAGIGKTQLDGEVYYAVSVEAPIGQALKGKAVGQALSYQGKDYRIEFIC